MLPHTLRFGSPADIAIVTIVALIIFGPKKLPEVGRELGQAMRELRRLTGNDKRLGNLVPVAVIFALAYIVILLSSDLVR